jgi:hypothetical protein
MYKNNSRFSSKFKGFSPLQLSCNLTGVKSAIGNFSYRQPLYATVKEQTIHIVRYNLG